MTARQIVKQLLDETTRAEAYGWIAAERKRAKEAVLREALSRIDHTVAVQRDEPAW